MDKRERNNRWYHEFDERRMVIVLVHPEYLESDDQINEVPAHYVVCETCEGKGSHVNPSIDSHGISPEEFAEDPDFAEQYFSGAYDQQCNECHGARVVPDIDEDRATEAEKNAAEDVIESHIRFANEQAYERRMGY